MKECLLQLTGNAFTPFLHFPFLMTLLSPSVLPAGVHDGVSCSCTVPENKTRKFQFFRVQRQDLSPQYSCPKPASDHQKKASASAQTTILHCTPRQSFHQPGEREERITCRQINSSFHCFIQRIGHTTEALPTQLPMCKVETVSRN